MGREADPVQSFRFHALAAGLSARGGAVGLRHRLAVSTAALRCAGPLGPDCAAAALAFLDRADADPAGAGRDLIAFVEASLPAPTGSVPEEFAWQARADLQ